MIKRIELSGFAITAGLAALAFASKLAFQNASIELVALLLGFVLANTIKLRSSWQAGFKYSEKRILAWAIALMGLQLSFAKLSLSWWLLPILVVAIVVAIILSSRLAKFFGVLNSCGFMIGVGTAICGASAIAAVSPFLDKKPHETGVAVGVVNLLGTVGMVMLPAIALGLGLQTDEAGVLIGGSLQAVGQVVGAGYAINEEVGEIATLVKLGRVLMLGPVVLITALVMQRKADSVDRKKVIPGFIVVFILLMVLANIVAIPVEILGYAKMIDKILLTIAMAGIGVQIRLKDLLTQGPKALLLGSVIFAVQIGFMLLFIYGENIFN